MYKIFLTMILSISLLTISSCGRTKKIPSYPLSVPPLIQEENPEIMQNYEYKPDKKVEKYQ